MYLQYSYTQENDERFTSRDIYSDKFQADYDYNGELPADCDPEDCRKFVKGTVAFA